MHKYYDLRLENLEVDIVDNCFLFPKEDNDIA